MMLQTHPHAHKDSPHFKPQRPLGEILRASWELYWAHLPLWFMLGLFAQVLLAFTVFITPKIPASASSAAELLDSSILLPLLLSLLLSLFLTGLMMAVFVLTTCLAALDQRVRVSTVLAHAFRVPILKTAWVHLLVSVIILIGFLLFVLPGLLLASVFITALPVALVERRGVLDTLRHSVRLMRGAWMQGMFVFLFFALCVWLPQIFVLFLVQFFSAGPFTPFLSIIASALSLPLAVIPTVLLYFSRAAQHGKWNAQLLAQALKLAETDS